MVIRECNNNDLCDVLELQKKWENEDITYGFCAADLEFLSSKLGKYFYVCEIESKIVGFVYGTISKANNISIFQNGDYYIEIDDIYIEKKYRGFKIGDKLLDTILKVARDNGIERSLVYSSTKDMDKILNFYKKHDYKTWNIQMYK